MSKKDTPAKDPSLDAAYALQTPEDSRQLYKLWAGEYDAGFAEAQDYQLYRHVAQAFMRAGGAGPVLDVGAGTGLCGAVLAEVGVSPIDGVDISAEMLVQAQAKGVYRSLKEADLYDGPPGLACHYAGIVSSGTFTNGHVGPEGLPDLLTAAQPGALVVISINVQHFEAQGFAAMLDMLSGARISAPELQEVRIYGEGAAGDHGDDRALIATFRSL